MEAPSTPLVRLESIRKSFGSTLANQDISLDFYGGRIKALLGENGAGKSTLMNILSGRLKPDSGRIHIDGRLQLNYSTQSAIRGGIGMVYQHFMLVEAMTVAENVFLGQESRFWMSRKAMSEQVLTLAEKFRLKIDPEVKISKLSMGERQRVEILKLLHRKSRVLIFDEPTAVLTPQETEQLFGALRQMADQGKAVVFISHKLTEVMALADEIAILRKGVVVDQLDAKAVRSKGDLAKRMVGREVLLQVDRKPMEPKQIVLRIEGLSDETLKDVNLTVRQGEIFGIIGVAGNGQKRLVEIVSGLNPPEAGTVKILGESWRAFFSDPPRDAALSYVPEDRRGLAVCLGLDLVDNFLLTTRRGFSVGPWLRRSLAREKADLLIEQFRIQPPFTAALARQLSGGNLQKLVLAREFYRRPRLIVAEQPTQGLDIGATEEVWQVLLKARERAGILLVTGDLREALTLCDTVAVMFGGRLMDTFPTSDRKKVEQIGLLMAGIHP
ncbi:MAG: ABC transporter ATP-binding protein [Desulfobacteraceae bacterium]|nr:MAG: ABC transporter ATP-binding protein [Desulfobacteraceae bacterium]